MARFGRWFRRWIYPTSLWEFFLLGVLVVVVCVLIDWAYFTEPEIIMEKFTNTKELSGTRVLGTFPGIADSSNSQYPTRWSKSKQPINAETIQLKPDVEVRATVFTLGSIMSFVRSSVGRGDHVISASLYCASNAKPVLALQGSYAHGSAARGCRSCAHPAESDPTKRQRNMRRWSQSSEVVDGEITPAARHYGSPEAISLCECQSSG